MDEIMHNHAGKKVLESTLSSKNVCIYILSYSGNIFGAADEVWIHKPEYCSGSGQINKLFFTSAAPTLSISKRKADQRKLGCAFLGFSTQITPKSVLGYRLF